MFNRFADRSEGGRALAARLAKYQNRRDVVVLALPRGGVPVGFEVARALNAPLDVFVVRKLGVPGHEELAFGAIASGQIIVLNDDILDQFAISEEAIERVVRKERRELARREKLYRLDNASPDFSQKTVIIVDDGLATGATIRAAIAAVKSLKPKEIVAAAPVASAQTCRLLSEHEGVVCVCAVMPEPLYGVGMWYENFAQTTDEEVRGYLESAAANDLPEPLAA